MCLFSPQHVGDCVCIWQRSECQACSSCSFPRERGKAGQLVCLGQTWPSAKLPFAISKNCQKLAFFFFNWQKLPIFCWKKWQFLSNFLKKMLRFWQFLDMQMAIFRGSGTDANSFMCKAYCVRRGPSLPLVVLNLKNILITWINLTIFKMCLN